MKLMFRVGALLLALAMGLVTLAGNKITAAENEAKRPVRIGMADALFRDVPKSVLFMMMRPFGQIMKAQTGVDGELTPGGNHEELGQALIDNKFQLGVMHGIEFAWIRTKHPELQPLMIAVNQNHHLRAKLVIRGDSELEGFDGLKGAIIAMPKGTREHCRLFLDGQCQECGECAKDFFENITKPGSIEEALDDVVDGEAGAAVVDNVAFDAFQHNKPGRAAKLRVLAESEIFPAGVVVYNPSTLDDETLERFREGMLNAKNTASGKQLLMIWKLTGFEPVPDDYEETLLNIISAYPPPAPAAGNK